MSMNMSLDNIPKLGLGTYKLKTNEEIIYSMIHAIQSGYRMFDTAELYKNEHLISDFIKHNLPKYNLSRKDIWITTKVAYYTMLEGDETKITNVIENSINLFGGYVDLFLIHASNPNDIMVWNILRKYQQGGFIRNVGISNYNLERLDKFCNIIGADEARMIYANQIEFNPFLNRSELLEKCQSMGIRVIAYGSLYKYNDYIVNIGKKYSRTPEQILLQWAMQKNITVIPMSRNATHIQDNYNAIYNMSDVSNSGNSNKSAEDIGIKNINNSKIFCKEEMEMLNSFDEGYTRFRKHL